ncbi:hypothetical protein Tco_1040715, partial [Tanacetum coccineum]
MLLLIELGVNLRSVIVNCDNQSAIHLSRNAMFHERTKHINVRYHFIREIVESKEIEVAKIGTKDNAAATFTKESLGMSHQQALAHVTAQAAQLQPIPTTHHHHVPQPTPDNVTMMATELSKSSSHFHPPLAA